MSDRSNQFDVKTWIWVLIVAAALALVAQVADSPNHAVYDEQWFFGTLDLLKRLGLSTDFLREFPGAAGPTFTFVFAAIDRLFALSFPWLRFINVALLAGSVALIWRILVSATEKTAVVMPAQASPALTAASLIMLPTVGVSAGMALTEMPALFFIMAAVWLLALARDPDARPVLSWLATIGCGLAIAAAVLGRQNYLVTLPCLMLAFGWPPDFRRRDIFQIAGIAAIVALIVGPVFYIWGGLIPPRSAWSGGGFSVANAVHGAGYAGLITLLAAPEIFRRLTERKMFLTASMGLSAIVALILPPTTAAPMMSLVTIFVGDTVARAIAASFGFVLTLSAIYFVGCFSVHIWQERMNWLTRFAGSAALLGILSNARITHQFSSRYVFVFLPFIVLAVAPAMRMTWHQPLRLAIGACISLGALASYFYGK